MKRWRISIALLGPCGVACVLLVPLELRHREHDDLHSPTNRCSGSARLALPLPSQAPLMSGPLGPHRPESLATVGLRDRSSEVRRLLHSFSLSTFSPDDVIPALIATIENGRSSENAFLLDDLLCTWKSRDAPVPLQVLIPSLLATMSGGSEYLTLASEFEVEVSVAAARGLLIAWDNLGQSACAGATNPDFWRGFFLLYEAEFDGRISKVWLAEASAEESRAHGLLECYTSSRHTPRDAATIEQMIRAFHRDTRIGVIRSLLFRVRCAAATPASCDYAVRLLYNRDPQIQAEALKSFADCDEPRVRGRIVEVLRASNDVSLLKSALRTRFAQVSNEGAALDALIGIQIASADYELATEVCRALARRDSGLAYARLEELLTEFPVQVLEWIPESIPRSGNEAARRIVARGLRDQRSSVRSAAQAARERACPDLPPCQ